MELEYDTERTSYSDMLDIFWNNHDPTIMCSRQVGRVSLQNCKNSKPFLLQYMSVIFYHDDQQKKLAEDSLKVKTREVNVCA